MLKTKKHNSETIQHVKDDASFDIRDHVNTSVLDWVGLGAKAVRSAIENPAEFEELDVTGKINLPHIHDEVSYEGGTINSLSDETRYALESTWQRLKKLTPDQAMQVNALLNESESSRWIDRQLGFEDSDEAKDYVGMVTKKTGGGGRALNPNLLLNFLEWHNYGLASRQRELDGQSEQLKDDYTKEMQRLVKLGWVPKWVMKRIDERFGNTNIIVDDGFLAGITNSAGGLAGRISGKDHVIISPLVLNNVSRLSLGHVVTHELNHVLDGHDKNNTTRSPGNYGLARIFGSKYGGDAMNEAVVEHLAHSLMYGAIEEVDPRSSLRQREAVYPNERYLMFVISTMGTRPIGFEYFIAAHFAHEETDLIKGKDPLELLEKKLTISFPDRNVVEEIAELESSEDVLQYAIDLKKDYDEMHEISMGIRKKKIRAGVVAAAATVSALVGNSWMQNDKVLTPAPKPLDKVYQHNITDSEFISPMDEALYPEGGQSEYPPIYYDYNGPDVYFTPHQNKLVEPNVPLTQEEPHTSPKESSISPK